MTMNRLILAEYKKIFFLKFSRRYLLVLVVAGVAFGVVLSLTTRMTTGRHLNELAPHEVLSMNMLGVDLASIMLIAFAAMCVHREFSTKSIQASLAVTPARMRWFAAKLLTYLGLSLVISVVTVSLAYLVSQLLLVMNGMPPVSVAEATVRRMLIGVMVMPVFYCLLTVSAAFIFWSGAGAVAFALAVLAAQAVLGILPEGVQSFLLPVAPQAAIHNLAGMSPPGSFEAVSRLASAAVLAAWVAATALTAGWKFQRQDV